MTGPIDWLALLDDFERPPVILEVETFLQSYSSASRPILATCSDGHQYVLKGSRDRTPFNEHVISRLGHRLGAPIPRTEIVTLLPELHAAEPKLQDLVPGPLHASQFPPGCIDSRRIEHQDQPPNRPRFASLSLLYTWTRATDHQFLYETATPYSVWSVDHGHFLVGHPNWTPAALQALAAVTEIDPFFEPARLSASDLAPCFDRLEAVSTGEIAAAVAGPPDQMGR